MCFACKRDSPVSFQVCQSLISLFYPLPMTRVSSSRAGGKCHTLAFEIKTDLPWMRVLEMIFGAKAHKRGGAS